MPNTVLTDPNSQGSSSLVREHETGKRLARRLPCVCYPEHVAILGLPHAIQLRGALQQDLVRRFASPVC